MTDRWRFSGRFAVHLVAPDAVILSDDSRKYLLRGAVYHDLAPYLASGTPLPDGLADPELVASALARLRELGYVEQVQPNPPPSGWDNFGVATAAITARLAEQIFVDDLSNGSGAEFRAAILRLGGRLAQSAQASRLRVVLVDNYLDPRVRAFNLSRLDDRREWVIAKVSGNVALIGPHFVPTDSACWTCVEQRMSAHQEVAKFLESTSATLMRNADGAQTPMGLSVEFAAREVLRLLVSPASSRLRDQLACLDGVEPSLSFHPVTKRPQCRACGDPLQSSPLREPVPLRLTAHHAFVRTSGGYRTRSPGATVQSLARQISPLTGVISRVNAVGSDPDLHSFVAIHPFSGRTLDLSALRHSLRSKSSGKGDTAMQAEASAVCEAIERYSGIFQADEIRISRRFADFAPGDAIDPRALMQYSDSQYDNRHRLAASARTYVPERFDPERKIEWSPLWSVFDERFVQAPAGLMYYFYPGQAHDQFFPNSNGTAAGNTTEEAVLQGLYELIERDAFAIWWYNRIGRRQISLETSRNEYLRKATARFAERGRSLHLLDITSDLPVPTFVAVSALSDGTGILLGAGCHLDPEVAASRAVTEAVQHLGQAAEGLTPEQRQWSMQRLADHQFLAPLPGDPASMPGTRADLHREFGLMLDVVRNAELQLLLLDQTRPDIGMPVIRVVVPGLRHHWPRFAGGRLYDVPVAQGWLDRPTAEADLNPMFPVQ